MALDFDLSDGVMFTCQVVSDRCDKRVSDGTDTSNSTSVSHDFLLLQFSDNFGSTIYES